ncbi:hypothetical protein ACIA6D_23425 [Streptomyces cacaoi]
MSAKVVDTAVDKLRGAYRRSGFQGNHADTVQIGLFGNLVGAEITAAQRIDIGQHNHGPSVLHTFVITCSGFGCTDPLGEVSIRDLVFDCDHGDTTEDGRRAACKQAQAHAETCRALPRPQ